MSFVIKFYSDPGHGWGAVKRQKLDELGIADKITPYSYTKGSTVYLEEDCDLSTLLNALKAKGVEPQIKNIYSAKPSPIRRYARFTV